MLVGKFLLLVTATIALEIDGFYTKVRIRPHRDLRVYPNPMGGINGLGEGLHFYIYLYLNYG